MKHLSNLSWLLAALCLAGCQSAGPREGADAQTDSSAQLEEHANLRDAVRRGDAEAYRKLRPAAAEASAHGYLLDPAFQRVPLTVDESRRVRVPNSTLSLVVPDDWAHDEPVLETELFARSITWGPESMAVLRVHRTPLLEPLARPLPEYRPALEQNARVEVGMYEKLDEGWFTFSGGDAIYVEGKARWPIWRPELPMRVVVVMFVDGGLCYQVSFAVTENAVERAQPAVLEALRSLAI